MPKDLRHLYACIIPAVIRQGNEMSNLEPWQAETVKEEAATGAIKNRPGGRSWTSSGKISAASHEQKSSAPATLAPMELAHSATAQTATFKAFIIFVFVSLVSIAQSPLLGVSFQPTTFKPITSTDATRKPALIAGLEPALLCVSICCRSSVCFCFSIIVARTESSSGLGNLPDAMEGYVETGKRADEAALIR